MKIFTKVIVNDPIGFHLRTAAQFISLVKKFKCNIWILKGFDLVNARSILCILQLGAVFGTELDFILDGDDALSALETIQNFFNSTIC